MFVMPLDSSSIWIGKWSDSISAIVCCREMLTFLFITMSSVEPPLGKVGSSVNSTH